MMRLYILSLVALTGLYGCRCTAPPDHDVDVIGDYTAIELVGAGPTDGPLDRFAEGLRIDLSLGGTGTARVVSHDGGTDESSSGTWIRRGDTIAFTGLETEFVNVRTTYLVRGDTLRMVERLRRGPLDATFVKNR